MRQIDIRQTNSFACNESGLIEVLVDEQYKSQADERCRGPT